MTLRKSLRTSLQDLPNHADAVFWGSAEGWVNIAARPSGQRAVEAVLPEVHIPWRDVQTVLPSTFPNDWRETTINLPEIAALPVLHNLPERLLILADLDNATPDALGFVMAIAAKDQGVRAATIRKNNGHFRIDVFNPENVMCDGVAIH